MKSVEPIIIKVHEDLEVLLNQHTVSFFPKRHPRIILQFDNLSPAENES